MTNLRNDKTLYYFGICDYEYCAGKDHRTDHYGIFDGKFNKIMSVKNLSSDGVEKHWVNKLFCTMHMNSQKDIYECIKNHCHIESNSNDNVFDCCLQRFKHY